MRVNSFLIIACLVASFWAWQQDPKFVEQNLVFSVNNLMQGRYWILLTALFVHGSILHLFGNTLFLFVFGGTLESNVGSGRHLMVFLAGGLTGFLLSVPFVATDAGMVGASAAIFAVAACVMLVRPLKFSWLFLAPQGLVAILYFLYNVVVVYDSRLIPGYDPQVGYIAHVIGFVTGIPFGIAWSNSWKKNFIITLVLLGIYVAIITLVAGALQR
jgi:membrane associated rhomboid family serine protease